MSSVPVLTMLSLFLLAAPCPLVPNYFSYYDCQEGCITSNLSCTISYIDNSFIRPCSSSFPNCELEANTDTVCLRPNMPAVGRENIWPSFRSLYYSNATDPESDEIRYRTKLLYIASYTTGILLIAVISLSVTLACTLQPCQQLETPYQRFPAQLPDSHPNPYGQTTTQPLIESGTPATTYNEL